MNTRIQELSKQALKATERRPDTGICIMEEYNDKLVELVVRDVIHVLQLGIVRNGSNTPENMRTKVEMEKILFHFDIKRNYDYVPEGFDYNKRSYEYKKS